jgi:hypothetical protein|tara:strand:+ start:433 stop:540 length:108 start_codon:yes stop_codon:yes gene_type:complete
MKEILIEIVKSLKKLLSELKKEIKDINRWIVSTRK